MRRCLALALAVLAASTPAGAAYAATDRVAVVGEWAGRFVAAVAEPNAAAQRCAPQISAAVASLRDAASARAASASLKPCGEQIRAAYAKSAAALADIEPLPADVEAASGLDSRRFLADQQRLNQAMVQYLGDLNGLVDAIAANERARLPQLYARARAGGVAVMDGAILLMKVQQAGSPFAFTRQAMELRIITAEAARTFAAAQPSAQGFPVGPALAALARRAETAVRAGRAGWDQDRAALNAAAGGRDRQLGPVLDAASQLSGELLGQGDRLAALLAAAGRQPVLPLDAAVRLGADLNNVEAAMLSAGQGFAVNLQKIG